MAKLNMAKINTLIRKGYLLAGVVMAANMFVMNEMRASEINDSKKNNNEKINKAQEELGKEEKEAAEKLKKSTKKGFLDGNKKKLKKSSEKGFLDGLLSLENYFNLFGTLALSGANNYFKWWDYNPGGYLNLRIGCLGWRSKRLLDILQFDININLGRGISWSIPHVINLIMTKGSKKGKKTGNFPWIGFFFKDILRGFTSMPLTFHFSNFSISISLDSIIWGIVGMILEAKDKMNLEEIKKFNEEKKLKISDPNSIIDNLEINPKSHTNDNKQPTIDNKEEGKDSKINEKKGEEVNNTNDMDNNDPDKDKKKDETEKKEDQQIPKIEDTLK